MQNSLGWHSYYVFKPMKSIFHDGDTNWIVIALSEHTLPDLYIKNTVLPLGPTMAKPRELFDTLNSERPSFTSREKNHSHRRVTGPTFYGQTNFMEAPKLSLIDIILLGFHYTQIDLINHSIISTWAATLL